MRSCRNERLCADSISCNTHTSILMSLDDSCNVWSFLLDIKYCRIKEYRCANNDIVFISIFNMILMYMFTVGYGSWYDHVRDWEDFRRENSKYPILFVTYEDIHKVQCILSSRLQVFIILM